MMAHSILLNVNDLHNECWKTVNVRFDTNGKLVDTQDTRSFARSGAHTASELGEVVYGTHVTQSTAEETTNDNLLVNKRRCKASSHWPLKTRSFHLGMTFEMGHFNNNRQPENIDKQ
jgi:hypothetical protein